MTMAIPCSIPLRRPGTNPLLADTDADGVNDNLDAFPLSATETLDTDNDGFGNNVDADDDGDGVNDAATPSPSTQQKPLTLITMESAIMRTLTMMAMV